MKTTHQHSVSCLSIEQITALEHIAMENQATPASLVSLAVDALIADAARHNGWLPIPKIPDASPMQPSPINDTKSIHKS